MPDGSRRLASLHPPHAVMVTEPGGLFRRATKDLLLIRMSGNRLTLCRLGSSARRLPCSQRSKLPNGFTSEFYRSLPGVDNWNHITAILLR